MAQRTHIRKRSSLPNLCGAGGERYVTVRTAQMRRREGRTDDLCPAYVAALDDEPDPPTPTIRWGKLLAEMAAQSDEHV